jgi:hypothetical protein
MPSFAVGTNSSSTALMIGTSVVTIRDRVLAGLDRQLLRDVRTGTALSFSAQRR